MELIEKVLAVTLIACTGLSSRSAMAYSVSVDVYVDAAGKSAINAKMSVPLESAAAVSANTNPVALGEAALNRNVKTAFRVALLNASANPQAGPTSAPAARSHRTHHLRNLLIIVGIAVVLPVVLVITADK